MSLTKQRTATAVLRVDVGSLIDRETGVRLAGLAAGMWAAALEAGFVYSAWLFRAVMLVPNRQPLAAGDVFGAVTDAVIAVTGQARPVAALMARPAHDTVTALVRGRVSWVASHPDPVGEYVRYLSPSAVMGLLLSAGIRATRQVGGAR
jgi:hypothetical protein